MIPSLVRRSLFVKGSLSWTNYFAIFEHSLRTTYRWMSNKTTITIYHTDIRNNNCNSKNANVCSMRTFASVASSAMSATSNNTNSNNGNRNNSNVGQSNIQQQSQETTSSSSSSSLVKPRELMFYDSFEIDQESDVDWAILCEAHRKHGVWLTVPPQTPPEIPNVGPPVIPHTIFSKRQQRRLAKMKLAYKPTHQPPPLHTTGTRTLNVNDLYEFTMKPHAIAKRSQNNVLRNTTNNVLTTRESNSLSSSNSNNSTNNDNNNNTTKRKKAKRFFTTVTNEYEDIYNFDYGDDEDEENEKSIDSSSGDCNNSNNEKENKCHIDVQATCNESTLEEYDNQDNNSNNNNSKEENNLESGNSQSSNEKDNVMRKEAKRKERIKLVNSKMYTTAQLELPNEENVDELLFAIWDGVALKRSDIVKPTGLPHEVFTLNASFIANETDLLLDTNSNKSNAEEQSASSSSQEQEEEEEQQQYNKAVNLQRTIEEKHKNHRIEAELIRQSKFSNLHLDSKNGQFFIPALMIVEGKADRRDEEEEKKKLNGESNKEAIRATPLGAAPGVKRTSTLSFLQYAGIRNQRDTMTSQFNGINNEHDNNDDNNIYDGLNNLHFLLHRIGAPSRLSQSVKQNQLEVFDECNEELQSSSEEQTRRGASAERSISRNNGIKEGKIKSSTVSRNANDYSTYFVFTSIREASKRFANPFGDSPNAVILEEKREPINPFLDLEGRAEKLMTAQSSQLVKKTAPATSNNDSNNNNSCISKVTSTNTEKNINEKEEKNEQENNTNNESEGSVRSKDNSNNNNNSHEDYNKKTDDEEVNESEMEQDLMEEWRSKPFACPFCRQSNLNALKEQNKITMEVTNTNNDENVYCTDNNSSSNSDNNNRNSSSSKQERCKEAHLQALYRVKRFRLLDSILDHFDEFHYNEWNHSSRALNESIMRSLYKIERNRNAAVLTQVKEYMLAWREGRNSERLKKSQINKEESIQDVKEKKEDEVAVTLDVSKKDEKHTEEVNETVKDTMLNKNAVLKKEESSLLHMSDNSNNVISQRKCEINAANETTQTTRENNSNGDNNNHHNKFSIGDDNNNNNNNNNKNGSNSSSDSNNSEIGNVIAKSNVDVHARVGVNITLTGIVKDIQAGFINSERVLQYVIAVVTPSNNSEIKLKPKQNEKTNNNNNNNDSQNEQKEEDEKQNEDKDDDDEDYEEEELIVVRCVGSRLPVALLMANIHLNSFVYVSGLLKCNRHLDNNSRRIHAYPFVQVNPPLGTIRALY